MADIIYTFEDKIYFNITNECPCRCAFCIRDKRDAVGEAENLFHDTPPTKIDIQEAIDAYDFSDTNEAVFCGYGEPTNALDNLLFAAEYLKSIKPEITLRLNTNGLSDLINGRSTAKEIAACFDYISISLNAPTSEEYDRITRNIFKGKAFDSLLKFAGDCISFGSRVRLSVVDVIGEKKINASQKIAKKIGADFICRKYEPE